MKRVTIQAPFTDGLVTDVPPHLLGPRMASQAENMLVIDGVARRRRGWNYDGAAAVLSGFLLYSVMSVDFALSGVSRKVFGRNATVFAAPVLTDKVTGIGIVSHHAEKVSGNPAQYYPRCVYRDELILCSQSGYEGLLRYAGAAWTTGGTPADSFTTDRNNKGTWTDATADTSTLSYSETYSGSAYSVSTIAGGGSAAGWFVNIPSSTVISAKILNNTSSTVTVDGLLFSSTFSQTGYMRAFGAAYPCVSVYDAGSVTHVNGTGVITGYGTKWSDVAFANSTNSSLVASWPAGDAIMFVQDASGMAFVSTRPTLTSNTSMTVRSGSANPATITTPTNHMILRGLPFTDACVHRESLVGIGVAQYPNRVYICPPGWDLETPPGAEKPLFVDAAAAYTNADPNYFLVDFIDVPTSVDTDPCVAVLPSPGPILVLKTDAAYGIYGDYPNFSQSLLPGGHGAGCIDFRATVDCRWGQFWAGPDGIHRYANGRVLDITEGLVNGTWRNLVAEHRGQSGFYCALGVSGEKLLVSIGRLNDAGNSKTLCFDLASGRWDGFVTNHQAQFFDAPRDDSESLIWVPSHASPNSHYLRDSGLMLKGEGPAVDAGLLTTAAAPVMTATTGTGMAQHQGIDGLSKMIDLAVSAEVEGPSTGHAKLTPSAEIAGGIDDENENSTTALPAIEPTASVSLIQRTRGRINRNGRTFAVKVDTTSTPTGNAQNADYDVKLHQITASFRDSRERA